MIVKTEKDNIPGLLLLVDFEKAFDSVSLSFLHKALDFFHFGPSIKQWIKAFYSNIKTCIFLNGQYSKWFNVQRGVRQGDPCSPYLYLICAEILSSLIRKNEQIKGIKIADKEILLSQFADDTTLCLDGTEDSFRESINVLLRFSEMSGLKINNEKTQVVWIGSQKNCQIRFLRDRNFCWDPGIFQVLCIKFSTDIDLISKINFDGKLIDIQRVLHPWSKRNLTPYGKIAVLKTLAISKNTHLLLNLPDPPENFLIELESIFYQFLWDGKKSKIRKEIVRQSYEDGGLFINSDY